jgi:tRNA/rRNA methyltransferase
VSIDPGKLLIVLHRPSSAENIGAACRVMKNFGLERLAIVEPASWSGPGRVDADLSGRDDVVARAGKVARHAGDVLARMTVHADLGDALGPTTWTCGTTSRGLPGRPAFGPRELAAEVARRTASGPVAIVFGEERRGLSDRELDLCQAVCTIPTSEAYDSMNLAQAVAVLAYELSTVPASGQESLDAQSRGEPARHATVEALWRQLSQLLEGVGYLNPQNPEQILAEWRQLLARANPTQREVELVLAAVRALERAVGLVREAERNDRG